MWRTAEEIKTIKKVLRTIDRQLKIELKKEDAENTGYALIIYNTEFAECFEMWDGLCQKRLIKTVEDIIREIERHLSQEDKISLLN